MMPKHAMDSTGTWIFFSQKMKYRYNMDMLFVLVYPVSCIIAVHHDVLNAWFQNAGFILQPLDRNFEFSTGLFPVRDPVRTFMYPRLVLYELNQLSTVPQVSQLSRSTSLTCFILVHNLKLLSAIYIMMPNQGSSTQFQITCLYFCYFLLIFLCWRLRCFLSGPMDSFIQYVKVSMLFGQMDFSLDLQ